MFIDGGVDGKMNGRRDAWMAVDREMSRRWVEGWVEVERKTVGEQKYSV